MEIKNSKYDVEVEAEKILIFSLIMKPELVASLDNLQTKDFKSLDCGLSFAAIRSSVGHGQPVDVVHLARVGINPVFLANLGESCIPCTATISKYVDLVADNSRKRRIKERVANLTYDFGSDALMSDLLSIYRDEVKRGAKKEYSAKAVCDRFTFLQEQNIANGNAMGKPTGIPFLERLHIEYVPGHMWCIGALPGTGKTLTMIQMLLAMPYDCRALVISTEMTEEQVAARYMANLTGLSARVIMTGGMLDHHWPKYVHAATQFKNRNLKIVDDRRKLHEIENIVRLEAMQGGVDVVFLDYLQHVTVDGATKKYDAFSEISHTIQELAKSCRCTFVCFSQVPIDSYEDESSMRFKGAGDFYEDCDLGIRLKRQKDDKSKLMMVIGKNRHGAVGTQVFEFRDGYTRIEEINHAENS